MGHIPRSLGVYYTATHGELTCMASPDDVITVDDVFLPQRVAEGSHSGPTARILLHVELKVTLLLFSS
jgi:DNA replication licensing factor MCM7